MDKLEIKNSGIDISHLLMCVERESEWMYVFQVVKWFQDNIYVYSLKYGKNSYYVTRCITCMKENKYCRMWALRRLLFDWGLDGSYKDIRKGIRDRTQSKLLVSNLLNVMDTLWINPVERGTQNIPTYIPRDISQY